MTQDALINLWMKRPCYLSLEWIVMELPANPNNLIYGIYDKSGQDITKPTRNIQKEYSMWVLQDEESYDYEFGGW